MNSYCIIQYLWIDMQLFDFWNDHYNTQQFNLFSTNEKFLEYTTSQK